MVFRIWYFLRETLVSLWRNLSLTLAAILTVAISLSLVGSSLLIREGAERATAQFQEGVEFIVFMNAGALVEQDVAIRDVLEASNCNPTKQYWDLMLTSFRAKHWVQCSRTVKPHSKRFYLTSERSPDWGTCCATKSYGGQASIPIDRHIR